jgi:hypothetical protein
MTSVGVPICDEVEGVCKLAAKIAAADMEAWDLARAIELCRLQLSPQNNNAYARGFKRPKVVVVCWSDARLSDVSLALAQGGAFVVGLPKRPTQAGCDGVGHIIELALEAQRSGGIDVVVLVDPKLSLLQRTIDGCRCVLQSRTRGGLKVVLVASDLQKVDRVNRLLTTSVNPMSIGISLDGYRVIDLVENTRSDPQTIPYLRTLRKLRSTAVSVERDRNVYLRAAVASDGNASEKILGVIPREEFLQQKLDLGDADFVLIPCGDPDENDASMAILATGQSADLMSAAGAFEGIIATPEDEWKRWLI